LCYLLREKIERDLNLTEPIEEDRQVVVEVELFYIDLPLDAVRYSTMIDLDW
jgi:hypothetical protein